MQISIDDKMIKREATNLATYERGVNYYLRNKVTNFTFDKYLLVADAVVKGSEDYDVQVQISQYGEIRFYECSCPASYDHHGICKHAVAVLKKLQAKFRNEIDEYNNNKEINNQIFSYFENIKEEKEKKEVKFEIIYELEKRYDGFVPSIEFKIGEDRLYIVKNMRNFLRDIYEGRIIEFGKNFVFDNFDYKFSKEDEKIIDIFLEVYEQDAVMNEEYLYKYNQSIFDGKKAYVPQKILKKIFDILKNKIFTANILGVTYENISIKQEDIPLNFELKNDKNNSISFELKLDKGYKLIPLINGGEYIFYNNSIYNISQKQKKYFLPFYIAYVSQGKNKVTFSDNNKGKFISEVMPYIKEVGKISIDGSVKESFYEEELNSKIYFDKIRNGICAKIEFQYGEEIINPFKENANLNKDKIVIREMEKEKNIMYLFEKDEFKVSPEGLYLDDEERIFNFLYENMPKLQEICEIYYSEDFKNMKIKNPSAFSGGVRINESSNMLEFSFNHEDIENKELWDIMKSLRENKRYHRLKDGSFIPLQNKELEKMSDILDYLDISDKQLKGKMINLPMYRAMYLDSQIREANLHIERSQMFKQIVQNIKEPKDMEFKIPSELKNTLRDYQKVGFKWLKTLSSYKMGGILADDMGLGKTLQVIAFILDEKEKENKPALVIAPTSLVYNWQDEIKKFAPSLKVIVVSGAPKDRQALLEETENVDIIITSYSLIRRDIEIYKELQFSYCIVDEAQNIKNPNTINAKSIKEIKANGYFALTGTPIENSLIELWSIFDFVMPGYLLTYSKFSKKYEKPIIKDQSEKALKEMIKQISPFVLRRLKKDVAKELPDKIETKMNIELTDEQKKIYLAYLKEAKGEIEKEITENGFGKSQMKILSVLTRLRQICNHPSLFLEDYNEGSGKMDMLGEVLKDAISSNHKILLFSQFTSMLSIIKNYLDKEKMEYFYLDGSVKAEDRKAMVDKFQSGEGQVFLISLKAGGTGLNLTSADMVIHFDPWWNPAVEDQATDRAYRIGQKNNVQVLKFITKGTIEEKIYELQQRKKQMIDNIIQPGETMLSKMNEQEIRELFEI